MMETTESRIRQLQACIELLDHFERPVQESLVAGHQTQEPPAIMLIRTFRFGRAALEGMIAIARSGPAQAVCLPTLCRPFFEAGINVLWASRERRGWHSVQAHAAREQKKWAQGALKIPSLARHAQKVLGAMHAVLSREDDKGNRFRMPPNVGQILVEIEERDHRDGIITKRTGFAQFQSTTLWRLMCHAAHGHFAVVAGTPEGHMTIGVSAAILATFALLRATAVVCSPDIVGFRQIVETIGERIVKILRGDFDLRLEEVRFTFTDSVG